MKMKLIEVFNTYVGLANFQRSLPVRAAFAIEKNRKQLHDDTLSFETKRKELIEKYSTKDEEGKVITDDEGNNRIEDKELLEKELQELNDTEVEVNPFQVSIEAFGDLTFTPQEMRALNFMISE